MTTVAIAGGDRSLDGRIATPRKRAFFSALKEAAGS